jgi:uncharacterized protein YeaO (DUF488 family)
MTAASARSKSSQRVRISRVYDEPPAHGYRVLVDRLWPRGIAKERLELDERAKDVAPTTELRRWYGHDPARFVEFARRYRAELAEPPAADVVTRLVATAGRRPLTLLTATRDVEHSGATVLADYLVARLPK